MKSGIRKWLLKNGGMEQLKLVPLEWIGDYLQDKYWFIREIENDIINIFSWRFQKQLLMQCKLTAQILN